MKIRGEVVKDIKAVRMNNIANIYSDDAFERTLRMLSSGANFDRSIFDKGGEWFKSGLSLEDAPDEFKNNKFFVRGFKKEERLAKIEELERQRPSKTK